VEGEEGSYENHLSRLKIWREKGRPFRTYKELRED
jgi:hypothetical protein